MLLERLRALFLCSLLFMGPFIGQVVQAEEIPRSPVNLDLTSTDRTLSPTRLPESGSVDLKVGDTIRTVSQGSLLTPAEALAVYQVNATGNQSIALGLNGNAIGGSLTMGEKFDRYVSSVVIPEGVTAIRDFGTTSALNLAGSLVNAGTIQAISSNAAVQTATIAAQNITNQATGIITSIVTPGLLPRTDNLVQNLNLNLITTQDFSNMGLIQSSGSLSVSAGGSINNIFAPSSSIAPVMEAFSSLNLSALSGNFVNNGLITAEVGNINIASGLLNNIQFENVGGLLRASNGIINFRDSTFNSAANLVIDGGDLKAREINLFSGTGRVTAQFSEVAGILNTYAEAASIGASTDTLELGEMCITGDPIYWNDKGDIVISKNLDFSAPYFAYPYPPDIENSYASAPLGIYASKNIIIKGSVKVIRGTVLDMVAGIKYESAIPAADRGYKFVNNPTSFAYRSSTGGNIDLSEASNLIIDESDWPYQPAMYALRGSGDPKDSGNIIYTSSSLSPEFSITQVKNTNYHFMLLTQKCCPPSPLPPYPVRVGPIPPDPSLSSILAGPSSSSPGGGTSLASQPVNIAPTVRADRTSFTDLNLPATLSNIANQAQASSNAPATRTDLIPKIDDEIAIAGPEQIRKEPARKEDDSNTGGKQSDQEAQPTLEGVATSVQIPTTSSKEDLLNLGKVVLGAGTIIAAGPAAVALLTGTASGSAAFAAGVAGIADIVGGTTMVADGYSKLNNGKGVGEAANNAGNAAGVVSGVAGAVEDIASLSGKNTIKAGAEKVIEWIIEDSMQFDNGYKNPLIPSTQLGPIPKTFQPNAPIFLPPAPQPTIPTMQPSASNLRPTATGNELQNVMNGLINHFNSDSKPFHSSSIQGSIFKAVSFVSPSETFSHGCLIANKTSEVPLTGSTKLHLSKGSIIAFAYNDQGLSVFNLHDRFSGAVKLEIAGKTIELHPGHQMIIASGKTTEVSKLQPIAKLAVRRPQHVVAVGDMHLCDSEFSLVSCINNVPSVRDLTLNDANRNTIFRTFAALQLITRGAGGYTANP